jgi:Asp-tRNA(Asn)/Glu-tRNA(Gln) amidotransferase A subunit family amidase
MNDVVLQPAARQLKLLRAGEISIPELAEAHIAQIERLNPLLNAFADFDPERVRAQARHLSALKDRSGPLHGLPVTVKSSIATAGYKCEIGSLLHRGDVPREDAVVVARLRAAGALILGTTNCPDAHPIRGISIAHRAGPAEENRRPSQQACRRWASARTAVGRSASPRTSRESAL